MKPDIDALKRACPKIDEAFLMEHLARLGERYFSRFGLRDIRRHLEILHQLTPEQPVSLLVNRRRDGHVDCTVLGFDYPFVFSVITGILAAMGFEILTGDVFTYERAVAVSAGAPRRGRGGRRVGRPDPLKRRRIVDHFTGRLLSERPYESWVSELSRRMSHVIGLLEKGDAASVKEAKHRVNELVVRRLISLDFEPEPVLYPMRLEVDERSGGHARLKVVSEDTPAFLYTLTNALSLQSILI